METGVRDDLRERFRTLLRGIVGDGCPARAVVHGRVGHARKFFKRRPKSHGARGAVHVGYQKTRCRYLPCHLLRWNPRRYRLCDLAGIIGKRRHAHDKDSEKDENEGIPALHGAC